MLFKAILLSVLAVGGTLSASIIPIANAGFETNLLNCTAGPNCFVLSVSNWTSTGVTATFKPSVGVGGEFPSGVPDPVNVAAEGDGSTTGSLSQILGATVQPNTTYTLIGFVGHRADFAYTGYNIALLANGITLASDSSLAPAVGTFLQDTIVYNSGANPAQLGQSLQIVLSMPIAGGQADFDALSLTSTPQATPEPATMALVLAGLAVAALFRRNRLGRKFRQVIGG